MKVDVYRIVLVVDIFSDAIDHLLLFFLVSAKDTVPDNKRSPVIFINVFLLRTMVYAVIGGCSQPVFDPRMQFSYVFGVYPKLKQDRDLIGQKYNDGVKSQQGNGQEKKDLNVLHPA